MALELKLTTYVTPKGTCPARGITKVETPGEEGRSVIENSVSLRFDLDTYCRNVSSIVHRIYSYALSDYMDSLSNKLLGDCYSWITKYNFWKLKRVYFSNDRYRKIVWDDTESFINSLRDDFDDYSMSSSSSFKNIYERDINKLEGYYRDMSKYALQIRVVAYITDEEHDIDEDDEYQDITGSILQALPRLGCDVFKIGFFPVAEDSDNERNLTAYVTNRSYFDDFHGTVQMQYTALKSAFIERDEIPSLQVDMTTPSDDLKCGEMKKLIMLVSPKPYLHNEYEVIGGSVTAHRIAILAGRKFRYLWERSFDAVPIPGISTASLITKNYLNETLSYDVDTAEVT